MYPVSTLPRSTGPGPGVGYGMGYGFFLWYGLRVRGVVALVRSVV